MARKRMIDPSIWTDEGMALLSPRQQLLYIGLFSNADDAGRLKGSAGAIALLLPTVYGNGDLAEVETDLTAVLGAMSKLLSYEHDGRRYLVFRNFAEWQRIDRPSGSRLPPPPSASGEPVRNGHIVEPSTNTRASRARPEVRAGERKREEVRGEEERGEQERGAEVRGLGDEAAPRAAPKAQPGPSLTPLLDAFVAAGLERPVLTGLEAEAAHALLKAHPPGRIVACWQDVATGEWPPGGDGWEQSHLSFEMLLKRQRFGNWRRWREQLDQERGTEDPLCTNCEQPFQPTAGQTQCQYCDRDGWLAAQGIPVRAGVPHAG